MAIKTGWRDLQVTNEDGRLLGSLGKVVIWWPESLKSATIVDGRITEWPNHLIATEDEDIEADWNTPQADVDWSGFTDVLAAASRDY